jgi:hypothetical protein
MSKRRSLPLVSLRRIAYFAFRSRTKKLRTRTALRWVDRICGRHWNIQEVTRNKGELLINSQTQSESPVDLLLCLGIFDSSFEESLESLLHQVPTKRVLFSVPKKNSHQIDSIFTVLNNAGFHKCEVRSLRWPHREHLALAERSRF